MVQRKYTTLLNSSDMASWAALDLSEFIRYTEENQDIPYMPLSVTQPSSDQFLQSNSSISRMSTWVKTTWKGFYSKPWPTKEICTHGNTYFYNTTYK